MSQTARIIQIQQMLRDQKRVSKARFENALRTTLRRAVTISMKLMMAATSNSLAPCIRQRRSMHYC
jgi:hypothetical protein